MSKVVIAGDASGTGTFTISAPNGNTDRALVLPDEAGTVLINGTTSNVGIGTNAPLNALHAYHPFQNEVIRVESGDVNANIVFQDNTTVTPPTIGANGDVLRFVTNSAERARIDSDGAFLVGKTSDASAVNTQGINLRETGQIVAHSGTGGAPIYACRDNNGDGLIFYRDGAVRGKVVINTSSVSYNTSSDYRLKENVVGLGNASSRVLQLNPVRFNFIGDSNTVDGFLAHEAQAVVPEAVSGEKDAVNAEGNPDYQGIDQSKLVPLLTAALQEALARIETLEADVATLKGTP